MKENNTITKKELLLQLQKQALKINLEEIKILSSSFNKDQKHIPENYKKKYQDTYLKPFIKRLNKLKNDPNNYTGSINKTKLKNTINNLKKSTIIDKIYFITTVYATFILEEPIHPEGTIFPGKKQVVYKNKKYYCPVKENQIQNPNAICKYCIAKQSL
ncbi:MAG: DUF2115 family protein [Methanobacteriaceae archaeon]|nr:DUF2115 family protein [Methanobacteriaceae archaeon]